MPQILETDVGEIEFPDNYAPEQIQDWITNKLPSERERIKLSRSEELAPRSLRALGRSGWETVQGLARGLFDQRDELGKQFMEEAAVASAAATPEAKRTPDMVRKAWEAAQQGATELEKTREQRLGQNPVYRLAEEQKKLGEEHYKVNPLYDQELYAKGIEGIASTVPIIAAGAAGPLAPLVGGTLYAAQSGQQGAEEAIAAGHPEKADEAYLLYAGLGAASEALLGYPIALLRSIRAARKAGIGPEDFSKAFNRTLSGHLARTGKEVAGAIPREAIQEASEQLGQNIIAGNVLAYDPNRPLMQGVGESAVIGGLVGGVVGVPSGFGLSQMERNQARDQFGQVIETGIDTTRPLEGRYPGTIVDMEARRALSPEGAQLTVVPPAAPLPPPAMLGPQAPPAPAVQPQVTPQPQVTVQPQVTLEPVNPENLLQIGQGMVERFEAVGPGLPLRGRTQLPFLRRLTQRLTENPADVAAANDLAALLDLRVDPNATAFPNRYREIEGGRLSRRRPLTGAAPVPVPAPAPQVTVERFSDGIRLAGLTVPESERGKGIGTRIVQDLLAESEATKKPIYLTASAEPGQQERLNEFYKRLGFEQFRTDPLSGQPMFRYVPKSLTPTQPEVPNAVPVGSPAQVPVGETPGGGQEVVSQVRKPAEPAAPQVPAPTPAPGQVKKGEIGQKLGSAEVVLTASGRTTTPFPYLRMNTMRQVTNTVREVDAWLRENAIAEAKARGDEFNARQFEHENPKSIPQASKDAMEEYLFGTQPPVVPSILKPLTPAPAPESVQEPSEAKVLNVTDGKVERPTETGAHVHPTLGEVWVNKISPTHVSFHAPAGKRRFSKTKWSWAEWERGSEEEAAPAEKPKVEPMPPPDPAIMAIQPKNEIEKWEKELLLKKDLLKRLEAREGEAAAEWAKNTRISITRVEKTLEDLRAKEPSPTPDVPAAPTNEPEKKAAEEALEAEAVQRARAIVANAATPEQAYEELLLLYDTMKRAGTRTASSKTHQAYSTPPPLAYIAGHLADVQSGERVADSTAGNGMLFIGTETEKDHQTLIANELDPNRNARLQQNFPHAEMSALDASTAEFHDYLSQWAPDRLVLNPPFGSVVEAGGKTNKRFPIINAATAKDTTPSIDLAIALNSLDAMAPDGRAVIIIGSKTGTMGPLFSPNDKNRAKDYNRAEFLEFFQRFNVTDWFTVDGKLYEKMGAGWPVDVIVINGKKPTLPTAQGGFARPWVKPPKVYRSWEELKEKLYETPVPEVSGTPTEAPRPPGVPPGGRQPGGPTGGTGGPALRPAGPREGAGSAGTPGVREKPGAGPQPTVPEPARLPEREKPQQEDGGATVVPPSSPEPAPESAPLPGDAGRTQETSPRRVSLGTGSNLLNVPYKPVSKLGGSNLVVPRNLADAMSRAVKDLESEVGKPVDDYLAQKLGWTKQQVSERFSAAQAEAVALFIRNLEARRTGLINSDQTGTGKGRTVAAAIEYALKNGKIPIFITAKKQLYSDMAGRDLPATGNKTFVPFVTDSEVEWTNGKGDDVKQRNSATEQREAMAEIARTGKLPAGVHGVFTTYDQLKADKPKGWKETGAQKMRRKKKFEAAPDGPRFTMLRALAKNAIFILDEAHVAAGQDSDVGLNLQSILNDAAGVYYASATFAKRPDNLSLYALGTAMKKAGLTREQLGEVFTSGGVPLQQALTAMLTESGEFVRREQNMEGVDFSFEATGTDPQKEAELADTYTSFLRDLFPLQDQVNEAAQSEVDGDNQVRPEEETVELGNTNFGARLFNLSGQYLFSLRADATVQKALQALKEGRKPFIAVYNTMAGPIADLHRMGLPLHFGGMLEREMRKMLEVTIKDPTAPGDPAQKIKKGTRKIFLKPEDLEDGGRYFYQLLDQIKNTDFGPMPISPIDTIKSAIKKAGYTIGELTGRKGEVENENNEIKFTKREVVERNKVLADYNNGALDALIVNSSADTGVSAHTDPRFKDQRQRHMIIAQPNPDINGFMQIVGRVMRFGQTSKPKYTIISTSLAAERRFNTMLRGKLNSLNANTTADTESSITQGGLTDDIFNPIGDQVVAQVMMANPDLARLAMIDMPNPEADDGLDDYAKWATGRFVLLPDEDAAQLWSEIADTYQTTIKALDDAGENPLKADVLDLGAKTTKSQVIQEGTGKTFFDGPVVLEHADVKPSQPALTSDQALELAREGREVAEQKAEQWLAKYEAMYQKRMEAMRSRDSTVEQMAKATKNFEDTKAAVEEAVRLLGETVAVKNASGEGVDFYAVPTGLMLKSDNMGDFSGASKHSLVLATNSLRRQMTLPLSQIARLEQARADLFNTNRDQAGSRHIVTGNLLRGLKDANQIARGTARPKVTIYSDSEGEVKTGVLMAPGWRPEDGLRALAKVLKNSTELRAALDSGKLVTAGPVLIRGDSLSVPSRNEFRTIWGDPQFNSLFLTSPVEKKGEFQGNLTSSGRAALFDFLKSKGLSPSVQTVESGGGAQMQIDRFGRPLKIAYTNDQPSTDERGAITRVREALVEFFGPTHGDRAVKWVSPDLTDESTALRLGMGSDSRRAIEETFGRKLTFFDAAYPVNGLILPPIPDRIFLNVHSNNPIPTVVFHEMMERLKIERPDDYAALQQVLQEELREDAYVRYARGLERLTGETEPRNVMRELSADFLAHEMQTKDFWGRMAKRLGPKFLGIGRTILKWLNGLVRDIRGFKTTEFFHNVERVREALADAMAKYTQAGPQATSTEGEPKAFFQLADVFRSKDSLEEFIQKPTISPEEAASLKQQAGAQAALVPDEIAEEIRQLDPADPVEKRVASLTDFVLRLHDMAPALEIQRIIADTNLPDDVKDAAISGVLRQIEHVRVKSTEIDDELQKATRNLVGRVKSMGKIREQELIHGRSKTVLERLVSGYKAYLLAQAGKLPADHNLAAARKDLLRRMEVAINDVDLRPDATTRALEAIAARIGELPVAQGPQAVIDAIREKDILRGKVGDSTIEMLTQEKVGGLPPLLLNPEINDLLVGLADLQKKAGTYAKQIEVFEKAFHGAAPGQPSTTGFQGEPTPVNLRKWAETYRRFRNQHADAARAIAEHSREFREAREDFQVYSHADDILTRLQEDPAYRQQITAALTRPGGELFNDIARSDENRETVYTSPLKQKDDTGKEFQNKFKVHLAPDRQADEATIAEMENLVAEIDRFLGGENDETIDPVEERTWRTRRDYLTRFSMQPRFSQRVPTLANPFSWVQFIAGGRARGPRSELEQMGVRAADEANNTFRIADQALNGYRLVTNNKVFGDWAINVAVIDAVKSHGWDKTRIRHWDEHVLNPIIAAGQTAGQMRLKVGDYIPGTGVKVTKEDMEVARLQKRYSQGIVQTTQGTAKGTPQALSFNPIRIEDNYGGRKVLRGALGPGSLTMARRFSLWAKTFSAEWTKAGITQAGRRRLVTDGSNFKSAVLGYVSTTNPEYANNSPLLKVYETFATRAKEDENYQVQSLDQLVERLAEIAVAEKLFPTLDEAKQQIEATLLSEIGQHVAAYQAQFTEEGFTGDSPQTVTQFASAASSFTKKRTRMVAPDPYYDYTLSHDSDRIGFVGAGYQQFQLKQIESLKDLSKALDRKKSEFEGQIQRLEDAGKTPRAARKEVQEETKKQYDEVRFSYERLLNHKRVIDNIVKDLEKTVIDVRNPNDSAALFALSRFSSTLSSALLANPMAIANNMLGGTFASQFVTHRNLGRANIILSPIRSTRDTAAALSRKLLAIYPVHSAIGKIARANLPLVSDLAKLVDEEIRREIQFQAELREWGLAAKPDLKNRFRAQGELKDSAGRIEREPTPAMEAVPNWMESLPFVRQLFGQLRDKSPRVVDELVNEANAKSNQRVLFDWLRLRATQAFEAREELARTTGRDINDINDFTKEENLLTPDELGMPKASGHKDADSLRRLFQLVGNLDGFLLDYYERQKAAPEDQKANVPLFTDSADEGAVQFDIGAHGNIPTPGFTPPAMSGVGQSGAIKRLLFMFQNYVLRHAAQSERLTEIDRRDPKVWRNSYAWWSMLAALIIAAIAGAFSTELGTRFTRLLTGRSPSRVTAANVMANPDIGIVARYVGTALANNIPYYGQILSRALGNPGQGSWWDVAEIVPIAGLMKDASIAVSRTAQTGDVVYPAVDFLNRWFPPSSPVTRFLPGIGGDIEARNAARALRVAGPSEGMELAGGGGANYAQTPATIATRKLINAAYNNDAEGVRKAFAAAVEARRAAGSKDPERAVLASLEGQIPGRKAFGRPITAAEEAGLRSRLSGAQLQDYDKAQSAFNLINQTLGTNYSLTKKPARVAGAAIGATVGARVGARIGARRAGGGRRRRSLFAGSQLGKIRKQRRSRRSPFNAKAQNTRRKRRSPAYSLAV